MPELLSRSGRLDRDHGDWLVTEPVDADPQARYFLVRDEEYIRVMEAIDGKRLRLLLKPVAACDLVGGSSEYACIFQGRAATVYNIEAYCTVGG